MCVTISCSIRLADRPISSSAAAGSRSTLRPRLAPALGIADDPDKVGDGMRPIVVIGGDEALIAPAIVELAVFDSQDFVSLGGHGRLSCKLLPHRCRMPPNWA